MRTRAAEHPRAVERRLPRPRGGRGRGERGSGAELLRTRGHAPCTLTRLIHIRLGAFPPRRRCFSESHPLPDSDHHLDAGPDTGTDPKPNLNANTGISTDPNTHPGTENGTDQNADPYRDTGTDADPNTNADTDTDTMTTHTGPDIDP